MEKNRVSATVRNKCGLVLVVLGIVLVFATSKVEGAGFQNPPQGAAASAQAGAFVAQADDATAITHNPAGLTQVSGTSVLLAPAFIYPYFYHVKKTPKGNVYVEIFSMGLERPIGNVMTP